jgi:hypothetical protein
VPGPSACCDAACVQTLRLAHRAHLPQRAPPTRRTTQGDGHWSARTQCSALATHALRASGRPHQPCGAPQARRRRSPTARARTVRMPGFQFSAAARALRRRMRADAARCRMCGAASPPRAPRPGAALCGSATPPRAQQSGRGAACRAGRCRARPRRAAWRGARSGPPCGLGAAPPPPASARGRPRREARRAPRGAAARPAQPRPYPRLRRAR